MAKAKIIIERELVPDEDPDTSYLEQEGFEDRMRQYENGLFSFVGVRAVAHIEVPCGSAWIMSTIKSPGLWGIEDDSSEAYFNDVFEEEKRTLLEMLESMREFEVVA